MSSKKHRSGPKVLVYDIETAPILGSVWQLWDQNVALNQINKDWHVLSWGAKWLDDTKTIHDKNRRPEIMYMDQRKAKNVEDDRKLLEGIWKLLDEADIVITQNGKKFDEKKLNARFIISGMKPPSSYKHIDTLQLAKKHFGFTSNKLEYMADKVNTRYKKLKHETFSGFELWKECLIGNQKAWKEMERYNKHDVLSLEELYTHMIPWDTSINFNVYHDSETNKCTCGSTEFARNGFAYTSTGKFQRYTCKECGAETKDAKNAFSEEKAASLKRPGKR